MQSCTGPAIQEVAFASFESPAHRRSCIVHSSSSSSSPFFNRLDMNAQATRTNQIELSGSFPWPRQTKVSVSAPFAPFNSGSWEVSYGWTTKALTISCKGASEFVEATLVTMTGSFPGRGFPYGLSNPNPIGPGRFPPSSEWSQSYPVSHPGTVGSWQLVVSLPEHIEGPSIGLKAKTIASRNAG